MIDLDRIQIHGLSQIYQKHNTGNGYRDLMNETLVLVTYASYYPKLTTNIPTEAFILECRD